MRHKDIKSWFGVLDTVIDVIRRVGRPLKRRVGLGYRPDQGQDQLLHIFVLFQLSHMLNFIKHAKSWSIS